MSDKAITHEDLPHIATIEKMMDRGGPGIPAGQWNDLVEFVKHLRITAEADRPPLPEGWVLLVGDDGGLYPYWHEDNRLSNGKGKAAYKIEATAAALRDRLTPLRPTITEDDVDKAAQALYVLQSVEAAEQDRFLTLARAAFKAAGIEVARS